MVKYSVSTWIYGEEPLEKSMERLARLGYDGIEIGGEPRKFTVKEVSRLLEKYNLEASSICGIYTNERDLISCQEKIRRNAIQYVKDCARLASQIGAGLVIVVPTAVNKIHPEAPPEQEWKWAIASIREAGEYAAGLGVNLALEALNRYETYFVNRIDQLLELREKVHLDNVQIMVDCFHMNIEEKSLPATIKRGGEHVIHVHIADSNRQAAGRGHTDFKAVVNALNSIGYDRYLTMEFLPPAADPYSALKGARATEFYDLYTSESINHMRILC